MAPLAETLDKASELVWLGKWRLDDACEPEHPCAQALVDGRSRVPEHRGIFVTLP